MKSTRISLGRLPSAATAFVMRSRTSCFKACCQLALNPEWTAAPAESWSSTTGTIHACTEVHSCLQCTPNYIKHISIKHLSNSQQPLSGVSRHCLMHLSGDAFCNNDSCCFNKSKQRQALQNTRLGQMYRCADLHVVSCILTICGASESHNKSVCAPAHNTFGLRHRITQHVQLI